MPTTWVTLLPHLIAIWKREAFYRRAVWRCRCVDDTCDAVPPGDSLPGGSWSRCPYPLLRSGRFSTLLALHKAAEVAPLADWPNGYPAWLAWGMIELRARLAAPSPRTP